MPQGQLAVVTSYRAGTDRIYTFYAVAAEDEGSARGILTPQIEGNDTIDVLWPIDADDIAELALGVGEFTVVNFARL